MTDAQPDAGDAARQSRGGELDKVRGLRAPALTHYVVKPFGKPGSSTRGFGYRYDPN